MIFLDNSKRRKYYFRGVVVTACLVVSVYAAIFGVQMILGKQPRQPIQYADTKQSYHYYYSSINNKKIALTIDDGPRDEITEGLMDVLEANKVPAMFFFIGREAMLRPNLVEEAYKRGFDIGIHSFTHEQSVHNSQLRLSMELNSTSYVLSQITGKTPLYYRPPFLLGIGVDPTVNPYIPTPKDMVWTLADGFMPTGADLDTKDWLATTSEQVIAGVEKALDNNPNGKIMLLHEERNTVSALGNVIALLRKRGYTLVRLSDLLTPPSRIMLTNSLVLGSTDASTDGEVSLLQWFLYRTGDLDPYLITGKFGPDTKNALTKFQIRSGLLDPSSIDPLRVGITDEATRGAILSASVSFFRNNSETAPEIVPGFGQSIINAIGRIMRILYVYFLPIVRGLIILMVKATLYLVIIRCSVLLILFINGRIKNRKKTKGSLSANIGSLSCANQTGISVLIPAYNEAENIRATIESVARNDFKDKEIIVIDDGSTDNTAEIVEEIIQSSKNSAIKLIQIENGGKARALNYGVEEAAYDICVVLDADAVLDSKALTYFSFRFSDPNVGAVAGKVKTTGSRGFLDLFQSLEYAIGQNIDKQALSTIGAVGVVPGPAGAWRKADVVAVGGFKADTLVEDQDMTLTMLRIGKKVYYQNQAIAYTETPHNLSNFLKQRFRWVYGTMQCFWKHKGVIVERPLSTMSLIVLPNILIFNIILPLTYPFVDVGIIYGLFFNDWRDLIGPLLLFTLFDLAYAWLGSRKEIRLDRLLYAVPMQRIAYRQLLYYSVARGVVRAIEGMGSSWDKFAKIGETQRFYFSSVGVVGPETSPIESEMLKQNDTLLLSAPAVPGGLNVESDNIKVSGQETVNKIIQNGFAPEVNVQILEKSVVENNIP